MAALDQALEFLSGPNGALAVAAFVFFLGLLVAVKYLVRAGGPGQRKSKVAASASASRAPASSAAAKGAGAKSDDADSDEDGDGGVRRRARRYA
ncbi:hypothetical protein HYH03_010583 [Edaphochlamys debaryana]|uniref:Uncharacterized protein n=1 Tax=Edaphochlamys debaryana TaxID=47281 RepID=A0A836BVX9_9CHLO|nr:hypothetical protein HYH03_010583 [Edaphochlamys debaryana]|eukprot:KAG2491141.1 hypothetical protein HYH03_010583 [Edaphochlamys debaryana]